MKAAGEKAILLWSSWSSTHLIFQILEKRKKENMNDALKKFLIAR